LHSAPLFGPIVGIEMASAGQEDSSDLAGPSFRSGHRSRQLYQTLVRMAACTIATAWTLGLWYIHSERHQALVRGDSPIPD
jgi:hypothetical protein